MDRFEGHNIFGRTGDLQTIAVDEGHQIVEMKLVGCHRCLIDRSFGLFAIAHHDEGFPVLLIHLCSQSHANAYAKSMTEGSRVDFHTRDGIVGMTSEVSTACAVGIEFALVDESLVAEHSVKGFGAMTLTENKAVAIGHLRILGIDIQCVVIKDGEQIQDGEISTCMPCTTLIDESNELFSQKLSFSFECLVIHTLLIIKNKLPVSMLQI